jgi:hypothetical protein
MPKDPRGEKRPGDVIGTAIMVAKIATGEVEDKLRHYQRTFAGSASDGPTEGRLGGESRPFHKPGPATIWPNLRGFGAASLLSLLP